MPNKKWNKPPRIKVLEAAGAVLDGRVNLTDSGAVVTSSSGGKTYVVRFDEKWHAITSNDNASFYVGYLGYPSIAFLFASGRLPLDTKVAKRFAGVHWKALNTRLHNDYVKLEAELLESASPAEREQADRFIERTLETIDALDLGRLSDEGKPPKGW